ncbi:hypothetical protein JK358_36105 [Nocardia sp. 2]|uniref:Sensor histidine kinase n=1 Tax=Nocardia acididurans TaxID=2802282 RepID=A0ABS1MH17_9NOCA|nr:hypothetical protein [Nocardia acididurans]MBL1079841.1 hypothetical protein [Nocardia acididurans]
MSWTRELQVAPPWVIALVAGVGVWVYGVVVGLDVVGAWFLAVVVGGMAGVSTVGRYRRFGGRAGARRFYDALHTETLPALDSFDEVVRWNDLIAAERRRCRESRAMAWMLLGIGAIALAIWAYLVVTAPYPPGAELPAAGFLCLAGFIWFRTVGPRTLDRLDRLGRQGDERGYTGYLAA